MKYSDDPVARMLLARAVYLESMSNCLDMLASTLREKDKHVAADSIIYAVREQRFEAMLVRGQLAAW